MIMPNKLLLTININFKMILLLYKRQIHNNKTNNVAK